MTMPDTQPKPIHFSYRFVAGVAVFVPCLITANIIIVKQVEILGVTLPAAVVIFPISYIFGDVLTEVYGYGTARKVIWLGFLCNALAVFAIWLAQVMPASPLFDAQAGYERILGSTPRFLVGSFLAYLAGSFTNAFIMARMKVLTRGRWLWLRTIGSTLAGEAADEIVVLSIGFGGVLPWDAIVLMMLFHWLAKVLYEAIATPFTYWLVGYLKRVEKTDVYDYHTNFNPLRIS
jgi:queuosine precursor transporter